MNLCHSPELRFDCTFRTLVVLLLLGTSCCFAQFSDPQLRDGTTFVASVDHSVRASHAKPGDHVQFRVAQPFMLGGEVVPEGAKISGQVVVARKVDKKTKLDSLLAIVADHIAWKKRSVRVSAWIVGFGSIKFSKRDPLTSLGAKIGPRTMAKMNETTDHLNSNPREGGQPLGPDIFTTLDPEAGSTTFDPAVATRDIRLVRKPFKSVGTILMHDDGDIYLPKELLVMMEQMDLVDPS